MVVDKDAIQDVMDVREHLDNVGVMVGVYMMELIADTKNVGHKDNATLNNRMGGCNERCKARSVQPSEST